MPGRWHSDQAVTALRSAVSKGGYSLADVPMLLCVVVREGFWRERTVAATGTVAAFARFEDFVRHDAPEGLGTELATLKRLCSDNPAALDALDRATVGPKHLHREGRDASIGSITAGNTAEYALRKLRRDAPDLHARVVAGDLSPHAAMIAAGFRERTITVPLDPVTIARRLRRHLDPDQRAELARLLTEGA